MDSRETHNAKHNENDLVYLSPNTPCVPKLRSCILGTHKTQFCGQEQVFGNLEKIRTTNLLNVTFTAKPQPRYSYGRNLIQRINF